MKTHSIKPADINKEWVIVDCADQSLGRISSQIAYLLRGKHKPSFVPHLDCGDNVIAINADKVKLTSNKLEKKLYYHHTGYIVGLSQSLLKVLWKRNQKKLFLKLLKGCFLRISSLVVLS
jgi:large subunit ribosomal protein L13